MRICVLGAGGLGSIFGGWFAQAGADVTLIGRKAHIDAINADGLLITGVHGEHRIANLTAVESADQARGDFDYLIFGVKGKDNASAVAGAQSLRGRVGAACSFQNSVVKEQLLSDWLGAEHVIGFATIEAGNLEGPGHAVHNFHIPQSTYIGELDGSESGRVRALVDLCNSVKIGTRAVTNIRQIIWEKVTQIANAAGWSVTALAGNRDLTMSDGMVVREGAEHYVQYARELIAVYRALGYRPENFFAPVSRLKELDQAASFDDAVQTVMQIGEGMRANKFKGRTSMYEDVVRGRKTEVDFTIGPFVEKGRELGVPIPTVTAVYRIIKVLDAYLK